MIMQYGQDNWEEKKKPNNKMLLFQLSNGGIYKLQEQLQFHSILLCVATSEL